MLMCEQVRDTAKYDRKEKKKPAKFKKNLGNLKKLQFG
jgi:hypothetical protein